MLITDFDKYDIRDFTANEIERTGSSLESVKVESIVAVQKFRTYIRSRVNLLSITDGNHMAKAHPEGYAVDFYLDPRDGIRNIHQIYKGCLHSDFKAFGIYWNQKVYSFHGEVENPYRPDFARWIGVKDEKHDITDWQWHSLLQDPRKLKLG